MKKIIIQIYEIQTPEEAGLLIDAGVDNIGSVVRFESEWKDTRVKETVELVKKSGRTSSLIPLFNNLDTLFNTIDYYQPDIIHFCEIIADQTGINPDCLKLIDLQKKVKAGFPEIKIMRSIPIAQFPKGSLIPSLEAAKMFEPVSDYFLTDTLILHKSDNTGNYSQPENGFVGITGITCDWDTAAKLVEASKIPVILAGGINPDNLIQGIIKTKPWGIDSCTGTNKLDSSGVPVRFKKDMKKVMQMVELVRNYEKSLK
ncbi:N-(5'phosphoribosyl)anthranilate isomerase [Desulfonema limicola]|uniref:N-(5'-phosphoribosyl)anthranilate isomerase n=1 Tax=Desulfonema limicola TaxID=45656 RepID=A0A975GIB9_9BACT|nr:hypothetical protein [Desulfonema limicola]QTA82184.1 N-(5'phosphoribosyl)anthranilate isomerase [Desulfonema limicola]